MARKTPNMKRFSTAEQLGAVPGVTPPQGSEQVSVRIENIDEELAHLVDEPEITRELRTQLAQHNSASSSGD